MAHVFATKGVAAVNFAAAFQICDVFEIMLPAFYANLTQIDKKLFVFIDL